QGGFHRNWMEINLQARRKLAEIGSDRTGNSLLASHHAYFERTIRGRKSVTFLHGPWALEHRFACRARSRSRIKRALDRLVAMVMHRSENRALRGASRILVASDYIARQLFSWHRGIPRRIEVV